MAFIELTALLSVLFGILVIAVPKFFRYIVGGYFIITGLIMLLL